MNGQTLLCSSARCFNVSTAGQLMWSLQSSKATALRGDWSFALDANNPNAGLAATAGHFSPLACWQIPQLADSTLAECYVRGNDLVCTYLPSEVFPFRTQLYWTHLDEWEDGVALQLAVSVQTDLLDTNPFVRVSATSSQQEAATIAIDDCTSIRVYKTPAPELQVAMAIHPSDAITGEAADGHFELFGHFLEKGVIRRARLLACFLPQADTKDLAASAFRTFCERELPLTT